jgi:AcrR family transcriptional regulator
MPRAGLDASAVTEAAAALADELGLPQLSMSIVAERLGVKAPSLYKHVGGLPDLTRRVAILAATELGDELRDAMQGRAGRDALAAAAQAVRRYVKQHPGRYAATIDVREAANDELLNAALERTLVSFAAALRGYDLRPADEIHALRMLRSILHGFATIEATGGFQFATDVDASFDWMVDFIDRGLRTPPER